MLPKPTPKKPGRPRPRRKPEAGGTVPVERPPSPGRHSRSQELDSLILGKGSKARGEERRLFRLVATRNPGEVLERVLPAGLALKVGATDDLHDKDFNLAPRLFGGGVASSHAKFLALAGQLRSPRWAAASWSTAWTSAPAPPSWGSRTGSPSASGSCGCAPRTDPESKPRPAPGRRGRASGAWQEAVGWSQSAPPEELP